ncbi:MAG: c-type cytochrome [Gammaproteobacteria bacterium]
MQRFRRTLAITIALCVPPAAQASGYLGVAPAGKTANVTQLVTACAACHGPHGNALRAGYPNLAGQNYNYLLKQLMDFRAGRRRASPMTAMIKTVPSSGDDSNLSAIATFFSTQSLKGNSPARTPRPLMQTGYRIYQHGLPADRLPACSACHGSAGRGNAPMAIPALAGQHADYLISELRRFAAGKRHNSRGHVMRQIAGRLNKKQIRAVAAYAAALAPSRILGTGPRDFTAYREQLSTRAIPGIAPSAIGVAAKPSAKQNGDSHDE